MKEDKQNTGAAWLNEPQKRTTAIPFASVWGSGKGAARSMFIIVLIAAIVFAVYVKFFNFVPLYNTPLSIRNMKACAAVLSEREIDYRINQKQHTIMLLLQERERARMYLASKGLPYLSYIETCQQEHVNQGERLNRLENDLAENIRSSDGVMDAWVKIVAPSRHHFSQRPRHYTAAVMVALGPGVILEKQQLQGITHLLAYSLDGLEPHNVTVLDQDGWRLFENGVALPARPPDYPFNHVAYTARQVKREAHPLPKKLHSYTKEKDFQKHYNYKLNSRWEDVLGKKDSRLVVKAHFECSASGDKACLVLGQLPLYLCIFMLSAIAFVRIGGKKALKYRSYGRRLSEKE